MYVFLMALWQPNYAEASTRTTEVTRVFPDTQDVLWSALTKGILQWLYGNAQHNDMMELKFQNSGSYGYTPDSILG